MKKIPNKLKKTMIITTLFSSLFLNANSQVHKRNIYGMKKYTFSTGINAYRFNSPKLNNSYGIFPNLELSFTKGISGLGDLETSISYDSKASKGANRYDSDANLNFFRASTSLKDFLFLNKPPQEKKFHFGLGVHYTILRENFSNQKFEKRNTSNIGFFGLVEYDVLKEISLNKNKIFNLSLRFSPFFSLTDKKTGLSSGGFSLGTKLKLYDPF